MYQFFVDPSRIDSSRAVITGADVNHIRNVLRMKPGEAVRISDGRGGCYEGVIETLESHEVTVRLTEGKTESTELPIEAVLFQGLPKGDKMEWIIQKCTELGVRAIIPVQTGRSVVKLDEKKADAKVKRWSAIAESAAGQSKRMLIPQVRPVINFKQAMSEAAAFDIKLIPYENARGMEYTRSCVRQIKPGDRVAFFVGPEGGFSEEEIGEAKAVGFVPITLGKRILRTETAGISLLSMLAYELEP